VDERPQDMPSFLRLLRGTGAAQRYDVTVDRPPTRPVAPPRRPAWQPTPAAPTWQPAPPSEREVLVSVDALVTTRRAVLQGVTYDLSNYGAVSVRSEPEVITVRRGGGGGWGCLLPFVFFFVFPAFFSSSSSAFIPFLVLLIGMSLLASGGGTRRTTVHNHHVVLSGRFRDEDVYLTRDRAAAETVARALRKGMAGG
ncbi:MAG TPA: DUF6232 family protein, partial [Deinococcales bacterium]|nr:DUF6232 family protein [Deinococcales bacterium]